MLRREVDAAQARARQQRDALEVHDGACRDCGNRIDARRLAAGRAALRCLAGEERVAHKQR